MQSNKWKRVTKEELLNFIKNYPLPLEKDFFMDWYSWNDFSNNKKWPESMVARAYQMYNEEIYLIKEATYAV